ncbi:MAG TPA: alpha-amylase/4-alpha-glucanotransferase domain-containing protein [Gemmatimonadales bacterium]|nr:alpha-amylase/4-alpha-glucanotransferase domain-containing protein [Gemmatimonadales bacterium]
MDPLRFVFGVHFHQPVGNFDHVFEQHLRDVYRPLIERLAERRFLPFALHISGPLLEWLEAHDAAYLDLIGRLAVDGHIELLLAGLYEPVLASLPRPDRLEQIGWMRAAIQRRFGVDAAGLWLTERVWEPDLAADLADAGVRYVLVDDRHFLVSGFERDRLHAPFWTESAGKRVALFPIDERLRYLVPFKPPAAIAAYLRELRAADRPLAVLMDDGEKFGGWPGTKEWVYTRGWLAQFCDAIAALVTAGEIRLTTPGAALREVASAGLAYLPTASYREMETWALPADAATRLIALEHDLGEQRVAGPDGAFVRGGHWRNFLVKYPEANRMHKKMLALSALCRDRGDPPAARRAIGRAQCNDAYWHGVFGGLYLPHLRAAIWRNLALSEGELRRGEALAIEKLDLDGDGAEELWAHSSSFSAVVSPQRGGVVEEYTLLEPGINYADVLTRRREAYHARASAPPGEAVTSANADGTPSIHELEHAARLERLPPIDASNRALFVDRVLAADVTLDAYAGGVVSFDSIASWARAVFDVSLERSGQAVEVVLHPKPGSAPVGLLEKRIRVTQTGELTVRYRWDPTAFPPDAFFCPEISVSREVKVDLEPATDVWSFPVTTVSRSERGFEETVQGYSYTPRWPIPAAQGRLTLHVGQQRLAATSAERARQT